MVVFPREFTRRFEMVCKCGKEINGEITICNARISLEGLGKVRLDLSEASASIRYENGMVNCPGCGKELPTESKGN